MLHIILYIYICRKVENARLGNATSALMWEGVGAADCPGKGSGDELQWEQLRVFLTGEEWLLEPSTD